MKQRLLPGQLLKAGFPLDAEAFSGMQPDKQRGWGAAVQAETLRWKGILRSAGLKKPRVPVVQ